jgi:predicted amidophosphoribosyltransferase
MATPNKERRKIYQERKEQGLCPRCGKKKRKTEKYSYCDDCREFHRNYNNANSAEIQGGRQAAYAERIENGLCPKCGKKLGKNYKNKICRKCLDKAYSYM